MKKCTLPVFFILFIALLTGNTMIFAATPDINDDCSAYESLYDYSQGTLSADSNPDVVGDVYRFIMTVFKPGQYITYKFEEKSHAVVTAYYDVYYEAGKVNSYTDVKFWVSSDNKNWKAARLNKKVEEKPKDKWIKCTYDLSFDTTDAYLKIEYIQPNANVVWTPEIGHVVIDTKAPAKSDASSSQAAVSDSDSSKNANTEKSDAASNTPDQPANNTPDESSANTASENTEPSNSAEGTAVQASDEASDEASGDVEAASTEQGDSDSETADKTTISVSDEDSIVSTNNDTDKGMNTIVIVIIVAFVTMVLSIGGTLVFIKHKK